MRIQIMLHQGTHKTKVYFSVISPKELTKNEKKDNLIIKATVYLFD